MITDHFSCQKPGSSLKKKSANTWYAENLERGFFHNPKLPLLDLQVEKSIAYLHQRIEIPIIIVESIHLNHLQSIEQVEERYLKEG